MFFCEICEIFNNTYFEEHLWTSASKPKIEYQHSKHLKVARERRCKYVMNLLIFNQSAFTNWFYENLKKSVILHFTFGSQNRFKLQKLFICWCVWFISLLIITRIDVLKVLSQLLTQLLTLIVRVTKVTSIAYTLETEGKLNVHKTFKERTGHLLNVLPTFNLFSVSSICHWHTSCIPSVKGQNSFHEMKFAAWLSA